MYFTLRMWSNYKCCPACQPKMTVTVTVTWGSIMEFSLVTWQLGNGRMRNVVCGRREVGRCLWHRCLVSDLEMYKTTCLLFCCRNGVNKTVLSKSTVKPLIQGNICSKPHSGCLNTMASTEPNVYYVLSHTHTPMIKFSLWISELPTRLLLYFGAII